jgi:hypothetical protein
MHESVQALLTLRSAKHALPPLIFESYAIPCLLSLHHSSIDIEKYPSSHLEYDLLTRWRAIERTIPAVAPRRPVQRALRGKARHGYLIHLLPSSQVWVTRLRDLPPIIVVRSVDDFSSHDLWSAQARCFAFLPPQAARRLNLAINGVTYS